MYLSIKKNLLKIHDEYTTDHFEQVAAMALRIGEMMRLDDSQLQELVLCKSITDVGKVIIPNEILNKKDQLTLNVFNQIKRHPEIGFKATKGLKNLLSFFNIYVVTTRDMMALTIQIN